MLCRDQQKVIEYIKLLLSQNYSLAMIESLCYTTFGAKVGLKFISNQIKKESEIHA